MITLPVTDDFNRGDDALHGIGTAADAHGWFTNGAVSGDLQIVSSEVTTGGAGWCQALQRTVYTLPAYARVQLTGHGSAFTDEESFALVLMAQRDSGSIYDQDYTGHIFMVSPVSTEDSGAGRYLIGSGGNYGDGRLTDNSVSGTFAVNNGDDFALTIENHASNPDITSGYMRLTGWQDNGGGFFEVDRIEQLITDLHVTFPPSSDIDYATGFIGLRIFTPEITLDNWGGGALVADSPLDMSLGGTVSPIGTSRRDTTHKLAAVTTPSGVANRARAIPRSVDGVVLPTGVLPVKATTKRASSVSLPVGVPAKGLAKVAAGSTASSGVVLKFPGKSAVATVAGAGSIAKAMTRHFASGNTPRGNVLLNDVQPDSDPGPPAIAAALLRRRRQTRER